MDERNPRIERLEVKGVDAHLEVLWIVEETGTLPATEAVGGQGALVKAGIEVRSLETGSPWSLASLRDRTRGMIPVPNGQNIIQEVIVARATQMTMIDTEAVRETEMRVTGVPGHRMSFPRGRKGA